jgi:hypothetical protein
MITKPWRILHIQGHEVLLCLFCDRYSANVHDITARYCGFCHRWLEGIDNDAQRPDEDQAAAARPVSEATP